MVYFSGLKSIVDKEGVLGLWKGVGPSILRLSLGSAGQLSTYTQVKETLVTEQYMQDGPLLHVVCSFVSVAVGTTLMQPIDVIRTRIYNQPFDEFGKGKLYKNSIQAGKSLLANEGPAAFFKGWTAHYLRGAPHVCIIFMLLEQLQKRRPLAVLSGNA